MTSNKSARKLSLNQETLQKLTEPQEDNLFKPTTTVFSNNQFVTCRCAAAV